MSTLVITVNWYCGYRNRKTKTKMHRKQYNIEPKIDTESAISAHVMNELKHPNGFIDTI